MTISQRSRKILWVEAGGRCAICRNQVLRGTTETDERSIVGDEAHIVPASDGGPRGEWRAGTDQAQIDDHSNLILLCKPHHKEVDDWPNRFTIEELHRIKREHRAWISSLGENDRQVAGQAEKITAWPSVVRNDPAEPGSPPAWGATIRNGSELPVYQVHVEFVPIARGGGVAVVIIEVIPPGDWDVSGRKVYPKRRAADLHPEVWKMPERTYVIELRLRTLTVRAGGGPGKACLVPRGA